MSHDKLAALLRRAATRHTANNAPHRHRAEDEQGECPRCGYTAPIDDFDNGPEPDESGDDAEGFRTDKVTGESGADDPDNEGDRPNVAQRNRPTDRLALLTKAMREANREK